MRFWAKIWWFCRDKLRHCKPRIHTWIWRSQESLLWGLFPFEGLFLEVLKWGPGLCWWIILRIWGFWGFLRLWVNLWILWERWPWLWRATPWWRTDWGLRFFRKRGLQTHQRNQVFNRFRLQFRWIWRWHRGRTWRRFSGHSFWGFCRFNRVVWRLPTWVTFPSEWSMRHIHWASAAGSFLISTPWFKKI